MMFVILSWDFRCFRTMPSTYHVISSWIQGTLLRISLLLRSRMR